MEKCKSRLRLAGTTATTHVVREHKIVEVYVVDGNNHDANIQARKNDMQVKFSKI